MNGAIRTVQEVTTPKVTATAAAPPSDEIVADGAACGGGGGGRGGIDFRSATPEHYSGAPPRGRCVTRPPALLPSPLDD